MSGHWSQEYISDKKSFSIHATGLLLYSNYESMGVRARI